MNSQPISENLTLFETSKLLLQELRATNHLLMQLVNRQSAVSNQLESVSYAVAGFTNNGASFSSYVPDPLTLAYFSVMGPAIASKLNEQELPLTELMKGATLLARQLVDEFAAYRSERSSIDYLEEQAELINDPWKQDVPPAQD